VETIEKNEEIEGALESKKKISKKFKCCWKPHKLMNY
jgi:hypothetical protein